MTNPIFSRAERLLGTDVMSRLSSLRVIIFGVGGVGSWCAEGLVRSGIAHLTIVDPDCVSTSNVNRQLMALSVNVGQPKVEVLRKRLLDINPSADIVALQQAYTAETADSFHLGDYDYVIDAIDSLSHKMDLILHATRRDLPCTLFSAMGAALKLDPSQIRASEFWKVDGCPLAAALRRRMRRQKRFPERRFTCVWSPEVQPNHGPDPDADPTSPLLPGKAQINGSLVHITAIVGFTLVSLVLRHAANI